MPSKRNIFVDIMNGYGTMLGTDSLEYKDYYGDISDLITKSPESHMDVIERLKAVKAELQKHKKDAQEALDNANKKIAEFNEALKSLIDKDDTISPIPNEEQNTPK